MNRLKGIIYDIICFFSTIGFRKKVSKKALIVKTDEIGDYILWRKFITELIESDLLKNHEVHLCGNPSWKSLLLAEYPSSFTKTIWLNKLSFKTKISYRFKFLKEIYKTNYDIVINPIYSRSKRIDDSIVKAAKASRNYGMKRDNENYEPYERNFDKGLYQYLMIDIPSFTFEFYRNKKFTEFITNTNSSVTDILIDPSLLDTSIVKQIDIPFFVVFPGSRNKFRTWPIESFIEVSNHFYNTHQWTAIVCGSAGDMEQCQSFIEKYRFPIIDLSNKTSLLQMLAILKEAECLLTVDTGSVHLAASVNCLTYAIFNGSRYGRFSPYPKEISENIISVYPDLVDTEITQTNTRKNYEYGVNIPYSDINSEKIIRIIKS